MAPRFLTAPRFLMAQRFLQARCAPIDVLTATPGVRFHRTGTRRWKCDVACVMAQKERPAAESKKPGRTLKEKRAAKHEKQAAQKVVRKGWDSK